MEAARQYKARRPNMNFKEMGIPTGATLRFRDGDAVVTVTGDRKVSLDGEETSLTAATRQLLGITHSVQPSPYWSFENKSLSAIYEETYAPQ
jgi:hypothetical protein